MATRNQAGKSHTKHPAKTAAAKAPVKRSRKLKTPKTKGLNAAPRAEIPAKTSVENDREFKAHIYQQLVELQPYLSEDSQVSVAIHVEKNPERPEEKPEYILTLAANFGQFHLETEGRDSDHFKALDIAKQKMIDQLNEAHAAAIDSRERNAHIQALARGELTLH